MFDNIPTAIFIAMCVFSCVAILMTVTEHFFPAKTSDDTTHCVSSEYVIRMEWFRRSGLETFGTHYTIRVFAYSAGEAQRIARKLNPGYDFYCSLGTVQEYNARFETQHERRIRWLNT